MRDANLTAAMNLLARTAALVELEKVGVRLTRQQHRRFTGCYPEDVFERIADLTSHITLTTEDSEIILPATVRQ